MSACRDGRKGFSSFTATLSRMVRNVKRRRKTLAAQRAFAVDLCAADPPSSPAFFPFFSSYRTSSSITPSTIPPPKSSPPHSTASSAPRTANSSPLHIREISHIASVSPQLIPHVKPSTEKKHLHTHPSPPFHSSLSSPSVAPCRCRIEHTVHHSMWAVIMLALLCTFLCVGKEIAIVAATVAHLILLGLPLLARDLTVKCTAQASCHLHHEDVDSLIEKESIATSNPHVQSLKRSTSVPQNRRPRIMASLLGSRRSKSWTQLNDLDCDTQPSKASSIMDKQASISLHQGGNLCTGSKLPLMLLFTLCGLTYGHCLAVCIAVCCILIWSKMEGFFF